MAIISILTDNHGRYRGTEVSPGFMEKGWKTKVFESPRKDLCARVVADFMSAITFVTKKDPYATMFSSSVVEFIENHQGKFAFFKFTYLYESKYEQKQIVIAPAIIKNQYDFCQYLADNEIYDVPEGYRSCWFMAFHEFKGHMFKNELKRRYPVVNGSVVVTIDEKRHGFLLHFAKVSEYTGFINANSDIVTSCFSTDHDDLFLSIRNDYYDFDETMEYDFKHFINDFLEKRIIDLNNKLKFSKKEINVIKSGV